MKNENEVPVEQPTIEEEVAAIRAVLTALLALKTHDARVRVLAHARHYLRLDVWR